MRFFLSTVVAVVALAASTIVACADTAFLAASDYQPQQLLPAPPAVGTPAAKADMAELIRIEKTRTAGQFAHAQIDAKTKDLTIFTDVMGSGFNPKALPKTAALFADVRQEVNTAAGLAKRYFRRTRPYVTNPALKHCASHDKPWTSYPSGHSTRGFGMAVVLAALAPEKAPAIMARAADYAHSRLICSVHYPSDTEAGEVLGTAVAAKIMMTPGFRREFDAAKAELIAAHLVGR